MKFTTPSSVARGFYTAPHGSVSFFLLQVKKKISPRSSVFMIKSWDSNSKSLRFPLRRRARCPHPQELRRRLNPTEQAANLLQRFPTYRCKPGAEGGVASGKEAPPLRPSAEGSAPAPRLASERERDGAWGLAACGHGLTWRGGVRILRAERSIDPGSGSQAEGDRKA